MELTLISYVAMAARIWAQQFRKSEKRNSCFLHEVSHFHMLFRGKNLPVTRVTRMPNLTGTVSVTKVGGAYQRWEATVVK